VKTGREPSTPRGRPLDAMAEEAIDRFVSVLAHCGYSLEASSDRFKRTISRTPKPRAAPGTGSSDFVDYAAHVLTHWHQNRAYLLPNGDPRPIPKRGSAPSIEALVRVVGRGLTLPSAMKYLLGTKSIYRAGANYVPRGPEIVHPRGSMSQSAHHMRACVGIMRTLDHNLRARAMDQRWYQYLADNFDVPVSQLPVVLSHVRKSGRAFLYEKDTFLYRLAEARKPGEPTVPVYIGTYLSLGNAQTKGRRNQSRPKATSPTSPRRSTR
jgi:hypothetical protein